MSFKEFYGRRVSGASGGMKYPVGPNAAQQRADGFFVSDV
jgi:hypothetical protein